MLWSGGLSRDSPKECFAASSHSILSLLGSANAEDILDMVLALMLISSGSGNLNNERCGGGKEACSSRLDNDKASGRRAGGRK